MWFLNFKFSSRSLWFTMNIASSEKARFRSCIELMRFITKSYKWTTSLIKLKNVVKPWLRWELILSFIHHLKLVHSLWNLLALKPFHQTKFWCISVITKSVHVAGIFELGVLTSLVLLLLLKDLISSFWVAVALKFTLIILFTLLGLSHSWILVPENFFLDGNFFGN